MTYFFVYLVARFDLDVKFIIASVAVGGLTGGQATFFSVSSAYITDIKTEEVGVWFGYLEGALLGGVILGPILGGLIVNVSGTNQSVFIYSVVGIFLLLIYFFTLVPDSKRKVGKKKDGDTYAFDFWINVFI